MKKLLVLALVMFVSVAQAKFIDEAEFPSWSEEAIEVVYNADIMTGFGDGSFRPKQNLNRAEAVTLLLRAKQMQDEAFNGVSKFPDVPGNAWFAKAVTVAENNGWLTGKIDGKFHPADNLNRAEFAALIDRAFQIEAIDDAPLPFDDVAENHWFYEPIKKSFDRELLRNARNKYFRPEQAVSRAEAAWVFAQILSKPGINGEAAEKDYNGLIHLGTRRVAVKPKDFNVNKQGVDAVLKKELLLTAEPVEENKTIVRGDEEWTVLGSIRMDNTLDDKAELTSLNLRMRFEEDGVGPEENFEARLHGVRGYEKIIKVAPGGDSLMPGLGIEILPGVQEVFWVSYRPLQDRSYFPTEGKASVVLNAADGLYFEPFTEQNTSRGADVRPVPMGYGDRLVGEFEFLLNADQ